MIGTILPKKIYIPLIINHDIKRLISDHQTQKRFLFQYCFLFHFFPQDLSIMDLEKVRRSFLPPENLEESLVVDEAMNEAHDEGEPSLY